MVSILKEILRIAHVYTVDISETFIFHSVSRMNQLWNLEISLWLGLLDVIRRTPHTICQTKKQRSLLLTGHLLQ